VTTMTATKINNSIVVDKCTQRLQAMKRYVKNMKSEIPINGVSHKASDVIGIYQTCLDTRGAVITKRAETKAAINERGEAEGARREADRALKAWVIAQFGVSSQEALDFGFPPPKVASRSVQNKTDAVALAKATRAARHTMGSRQKRGVVGSLAAPTAPAAPATVTVPLATPSISTPNQAPVVQTTTAPQASPTAPVATVTVTAPAVTAPVANGASPVPSGTTPIATGTAPQTNGAATA